MLSTQVFASTITNLTDARYFAAWEVAWLGFNLDAGTPEALPADDIRSMINWVDGVRAIGEVSMLTQEIIDFGVNDLGLQGFSFGPFTELKVMEAIPNDLDRIQLFPVDHPNALSNIRTTLNSRKELVDYCALDLSVLDPNFQSWPDQDQHWLKDIGQQFKVLLKLSPNANVMDWLNSGLTIHGLVLLGGAEEKIGYKSFDDLDDVFEQLEVLV